MQSFGANYSLSEKTPFQDGLEVQEHRQRVKKEISLVKSGGKYTLSANVAVDIFK